MIGKDEQDNDLDDDEDEAGERDLHAVVVAEHEAGGRLDRFLAEKIGLSRARIQTLIRDGHVASADGPLTDPATKTRAGATLSVAVPPAEAAEPIPQSMPLAVVYEDRHLIVIDKPAGLVVHPAAGHAQGTLVNALIAHCGAELSGIGGVRRPGIVHRLDKDTSGLLVVAKTDAAHHGLSEQFASHGVDGRLVRTYEALIWGVPKRATGSIAANLGRSRTKRTRMAVMRGGEGRHAVTHYETAEYFVAENRQPLAARLLLQLETGRTHQIRVHLAHIGHPVMGDPAYGTGFKASSRRLSEPADRALQILGRQALHACELGFEHPVTRKRLRFTSPRPPDIETLYQALKASPNEPPPPKRTKVSKR